MSKGFAHTEAYMYTHILSLCSDAWKAVLASSYSLSHKEGLSLRSMLRESQLYFQHLTVVSGFVTFSYLAAENGYREEVQLLTVLFKSISNVPHWAVTCVFPFFKKKKKSKFTSQRQHLPHLQQPQSLSLLHGERLQALKMLPLFLSALAQVKSQYSIMPHYSLSLQKKRLWGHFHFKVKSSNVSWVRLVATDPSVNYLKRQGGWAPNPYVLITPELHVLLQKYSRETPRVKWAQSLLHSQYGQSSHVLPEVTFSGAVGVAPTLTLLDFLLGLSSC